MNIKTTHETILGWIRSCQTAEQLVVAHEAVIKLYDNLYNTAGSPESQFLHSACLNRKSELEQLAAPRVTAFRNNSK